MKIRLLIIFLRLIIPVSVFSQIHMKFMGIPIDGNVNLFCQKLMDKGFAIEKSDLTNAYCFIGKFYGENANIQVDYTYDTHTVYSVTVYIVKSSASALYSLQRDYLKAVEEKYKYEKEIINPLLCQYDYWIYEGFNPIGLIQTFIVDSNSIESIRESMLSITYVDCENYASFEDRKNKDI